MLTQTQLELELAGIADRLERRIAFTALLTAAFEELGFLPPVIVGGQAVEFYTSGGYATADIDVVASSEALDTILAAWGFHKSGRHWMHDDLSIAIEAPGGRLEGERARTTQVRMADGYALVIGVEDLIVDRMCAYVNWKSASDKRWAAILLHLNRSRVDQKYLLRRAGIYGVEGEVEELLQDPGP